MATGGNNRVTEWNFGWRISQIAYNKTTESHQPPNTVPDFVLPKERVLDQKRLVDTSLQQRPQIYRFIFGDRFYYKR